MRNPHPLGHHPLLLAALVALTTLSTACGDPPTAEEIRHQASQDFYALLRHSAQTFDDAQNRKALDAAATRLSNLGGDKKAISVFADYIFKKDIEHFIVEMDKSMPKIFDETKAIADISDGKRFRVSVKDLCEAISKPEDCQGKDLPKVIFDLDVSVDGDTVHIAIGLADKPKAVTLSINAKQLVIDLDGNKTLSAINDINATLGHKLIELRKLAGTWHIDWRRDGAGLRVATRLDNVDLLMDMPGGDDDDVVTPNPGPGPGPAPAPVPSHETVEVQFAATHATATAVLAGGKASIESSVGLKAFRLPYGKSGSGSSGPGGAGGGGSSVTHYATFETGTLHVSASSDGSGTIVASLDAGKTPALMKVDGKTAISALLDSAAKPWKVTLAPHGDLTSLTLADAAKPSLEIHPDVLDSHEKPYADPKISGDLSAGLSVLIRGDHSPFLEVLAGSATLKNNGKTFKASQGQCVGSVDPQQDNSLLDFLATGQCS